MEDSERFKPIRRLGNTFIRLPSGITATRRELAKEDVGTRSFKLLLDSPQAVAGGCPRLHGL